MVLFLTGRQLVSSSPQSPRQPPMSTTVSNGVSTWTRTGFLTFWQDSGSFVQSQRSMISTSMKFPPRPKCASLRKERGWQVEEVQEALDPVNAIERVDVMLVSSSVKSSSRDNVEELASFGEMRDWSARNICNFSFSCNLQFLILYELYLLHNLLNMTWKINKLTNYRYSQRIN